MKSCLPAAVFLLSAAAGFSGVQVESTQVYSDSKLGLTVLKGSLQLPAAGYWYAVEPATDAGVRQVFLYPTDEAARQMRGERGQKAERMQEIEKSGNFLRTVFWICHQYAMTNNGLGPSSFSDIPGVTNQTRFMGGGFALADFHLVPGITITNRRGPAGQGLASVPLVIEVNPFVDDGKHWILLSNGQSERKTIDQDMVSKYGLKISPKNPDDIAAAPAIDGTAEYHVLALRSAPDQVNFSLTVKNSETGEELTCPWASSSAVAGAAGLLGDWARLRADTWNPMLSSMDTPILRYWRARMMDLYGTQPEPESRPRRFGRGEMADAFSVLSGRAAVRETLQMQALAGDTQAPADRTIPIGDLASVEVKSHPFEEMLEGAPGGSIPLADSFPSDRAWVYFAQPDALLPMLNGGAEFAFNAGSLAVRNCIAYDLKSRYLARLGLTEEWIRNLLAAGAVKEMAFGAPDLFFIDGTEITVAARVPVMSLLDAALQALGLPKLSREITEHTTDLGDTSYWAVDGDVLLISTHRQELETVLALRKAEGAGSLGKSPEFRYMLTQLPVEPDTAIFCYLSDPFIRRLVGPQTKIAQLRRLQARTDLESLSAAALLHRLDGQPGTPTLETLAGKGYAAKSLLEHDYSLGADLVARSTEYGTPAALKSLLQAPVVKVTTGEASAYANYLTNYSRFWRQYFDPIAFRLNKTGSGRMDLTTFILPLIDNSIYNGVRGAVRPKEEKTPLEIPESTPAPTLLLSLNLSDESWVHITRGFLLEFVGRYTQISPKLFDLLGPGVHVGIQDADPVMNFGGGDILGAFGSPIMGGMRGGQMLYVPILMSMLTRPCQLMVQVKDEESATRMLNAATAMAPGARRSASESTVSFYRLEGRDAWICSVDMFGLIKIRFGIEVQNGYLILSNIPWSQRPEIRKTEAAALNGIQLKVQPDAGELQLPGLFTSAAERERAASAQGIGYLYPMLISGIPSIAEAQNLYRTCFGFIPEHPGAGTWTWENGEIRSTVYGGLRDPVQPDYKPGARNFGVFSGISNLTMNLQFEDTGLRVAAGWSIIK